MELGSGVGAWLSMYGNRRIRQLGQCRIMTRSLPAKVAWVPWLCCTRGRLQELGIQVEARMCRPRAEDKGPTLGSVRSFRANVWYGRGEGPQCRFGSGRESNFWKHGREKGRAKRSW